MTTHSSVKLIFTGLQNGDVSFFIENPLNLVVNSTARCSAANTAFGANVTCNVNIASGEIINVMIDYDSADNVKTVGSHYVFSDQFKVPLDAQSAFILVKLPEGTGLIVGDEALSPRDASISSDGRRTLISWQREGLQKDDVFQGSIAFEKIGLVMFFPVELIVATAIASVFAAGLFYRFYWKSRNVEMIMPVLRKDEKEIFNAIIKHGNDVNQKIIVKDSGYSKAKVSKVLNSLRERGLVKLERIGRSNKVQIVKNFQNKA
jgi:DNA-binding transcriptional ArsR family regulator